MATVGRWVICVLKKDNTPCRTTGNGNFSFFLEGGGKGVQDPLDPRLNPPLIYIQICCLKTFSHIVVNGAMQKKISVCSTSVLYHWALVIVN